MSCSTFTSPGSEKLGSPKRIRYNPVEVAIQQRLAAEDAHTHGLGPPGGLVSEMARFRQALEREQSLRERGVQMAKEAGVARGERAQRECEEQLKHAVLTLQQAQASLGEALSLERRQRASGDEELTRVVAEARRCGHPR